MNQNTVKFYNYFNATLKAISYTREQITPYERMGCNFQEAYTLDVKLQWGVDHYKYKTYETSYFYTLIHEYKINQELINKSRSYELCDNLGNIYSPFKKNAQSTENYRTDRPTSVGIVDGRRRESGIFGTRFDNDSITVYIHDYFCSHYGGLTPFIISG